jgi:DNA invertase Pin-like site-specific DNA recombinase
MSVERNGAGRNNGANHAGDEEGAHTNERRPVIGYITVHHGSTWASHDGARAIRRACEASGWWLIEVVTDRDSGRPSLERPGVGYALNKIAAGEVEGLVVSELMRLVRSHVDLASLLRWFRDRNAALIALDLDFDTSTADGRRIAEVLIALGEWQQGRIAQRTKTGLAHARANGRPVGRPSIGDRPKLREQIVRMREAGLTLQAIADRLNEDGVATSRGGARWRPSSVQVALGYRRPTARRQWEAKHVSPGQGDSTWEPS